MRNFKIIWRSFKKEKVFSSLNIAGLSIGLFVVMAIFLYVKKELSFDQYHSQANQIYRVNLSVTYDDLREKWAHSPNISGPTFQENIPEVVAMFRLLHHNFGRTAFIQWHEVKIAEKKFYWADAGIFNVLDLPLVQGDPSAALQQPNEVIISTSTARRIFGEQDPMGKTISVDNDLELQVKGVFADLPDNSSFDINMIGSFQSLAWASKNLYWGNCSFETFLLLSPGASPLLVEQQMSEVYNKAVAKEEQWFTHFLQPLSDIHLHSNEIQQTYVARAGDYRQVRILSLLGLAVLFIACFNYINLSTARAQKRLKEVGIVKTLGGKSTQIIRRFLIETSLLVGISILLALLLLVISLPPLKNMLGIELQLSQWSTSLVIFIPILWVVVSIVAGLYPAIMTSSFTPQHLIQSHHQPSGVKSWLHPTLVSIQFIVCIGLIVGSIFFNRQINFFAKSNLGFQPEQVIAISTEGAEEVSQINSLKNAYQNMSMVSSVVRAMSYPGLGTSGYAMADPKNSDRSIMVASNRTESGIDDVLGLNLIAGRSLPQKQPDDTTVQILMNERGVEFLGYTPEEAIGKEPPDLFQYPTTIVGVVEDFHYESMHQPIGAYVFNNGNNLGRRPFLLVRVASDQIGSALASLESTFETHIPSSAFEYEFLDEHFGQLYTSDRQLSTLVFLFTILAIFVSCLGLFALAAYAAERREKEIGIRKVLGASIEGLVRLLTIDFLKPVMVAIVIAIPLSYWFLSQWFDNFAYHVGLDWMVFALAAVIALLIAVLTISTTSIKTALLNPVQSIKDE